MNKNFERDEKSEQYERDLRVNDEGQENVEGMKIRGPHLFQPFTSLEDLQIRVMESSTKSWRLNDMEKRSYRNVHRFFYEFKPGESFFDLHDRLIHSVHPEIIEKQQQVDKMSDKEFIELGRNYYIARKNFLTEKRKKKFWKSGKHDLDDDTVNPKDEEFGSDVFGEDQSDKPQVPKEEQDSHFDRGANFKWFKRVKVSPQEEQETGRLYRLEIYKDTLEDIDPLFAEHPRHDEPILDLYLRQLEKFNLWQTTRNVTMGFLCTFPILVGMVLARQIPIFVGGGDVMKVLKSKMVYKGGFHATMNRREAGLILGVKQNATKEEIRARHRKLMISNHPDNGGSQLIATKINEAKELMFKGDL